MRSHLDKYGQTDERRIPRSMQEVHGWYRGEKIYDTRGDQVRPPWGTIVAVCLLCVMVIWVCGGRV